MPAVSKAQAGLMGAVAAGKKKLSGISPEKAKEYLTGVKVSRLPAHKSSKSEHLQHPQIKSKHG